MESSPRLKLPYIMPSQAQKHVTHNEAIRLLDCLAQPVVLDRGRTEPPADPQAGDGHIVGVGATGAWAGRDRALACFIDGAWMFLAPETGWQVVDLDDGVRLAFDGTDWVASPDRGGNTLPWFGINTDADAANRFSVAAAKVLFSHEGDDHRVVVNKAAAGDTASVIFQTGWAGRAEFGLTGDDDWHVKVSADGASWSEALRVSSANGRVRIGDGGTPLAALDVAGEILNSNWITSNRQSADNFSQGLRIRKRGTDGDETAAVASGGELGYHSFFGWNGSAYSRGAFVLAKAAEAWSSGARGAWYAIFVTENGTTSNVKGFQIGDDRSVAFPGIGTTAAAANAHLDSGAENGLLRSTSSLSYKRDIEPVDPGRSEALLAVEPIWYRSRAKADNPDWSWYGFGAEDVAAVDPRMVHWGYREEDFDKLETVGADGEETTEFLLRPDAEPKPDGVAYDRFVVHHHILIRKLRAEIEAVRAEVAALTGDGTD